MNLLGTLFQRIARGSFVSVFVGFLPKGLFERLLE